MTTTIRSRDWSVTINNPTEEDLEHIALARQAGWQVLGQLERGENGTKHYQLLVKSPSQCRFSAVKKHFPRAHIEAARCAVALARYVTKEETRVGALPTTQDKYPSLSKYWELILDYYNDETKEALDYNQLEEGVVAFYRDSTEALFTKNPLSFLDKATASLIESGYHCESIAANPSTRAMWNKFAKSILLRSYNAKHSRSTETQQDANDDQTSFGEGTTQELSCFSGDDSSTCSSPPNRPCAEGSSASSEGSD